MVPRVSNVQPTALREDISAVCSARSHSAGRAMAARTLQPQDEICTGKRLSACILSAAREVAPLGWVHAGWQTALRGTPDVDVGTRDASAHT